MMFPKTNLISRIVFTYRITSGIAVIEVYDQDVSLEHPVYMSSLNDAGQSQIAGIKSMNENERLVFPGVCWSDFEAYKATGELPPAEGKIGI